MYKVEAIPGSMDVAVPPAPAGPSAGHKPPKVHKAGSRASDVSSLRSCGTQGLAFSEGEVYPDIKAES